MGSPIVIAILLFFVLLTLAKGVRIVPQGEEWLVQRLGRYHQTLKPGLTVVIPFFDEVAYKLVTKDIILDNAVGIKKALVKMEEQLQGDLQKATDGKT
jgi:regulator of protease activity HflC (stomatin/prohibitin superfamily)